MNSIIETKDLKLWYGDHQVLKGITMDIPEHQITALIGPSGCGKSTFLKTLNRMNDLVENVRITGEVKYDGSGRSLQRDTREENYAMGQTISEQICAGNSIWN